MTPADIESADGRAARAAGGQFLPGDVVTLAAERHLTDPALKRRFVVVETIRRVRADGEFTEFVVRRPGEYAGVAEHTLSGAELDLPGDPRPDATAEVAPPDPGPLPAGWRADPGHGPYGAANPPPDPGVARATDRHWMVGLRVRVADPDRGDGRLADGRCETVARDDEATGVDYWVRLDDDRRCIVHETDINLLPATPDIDPGF